MALLFMDSFDHYVTADVLEKWSTESVVNNAYTINSASGRRSTAGLRTTSHSAGVSAVSQISRNVTPSGATVIIGVAFRANMAPTLADTAICQIYDGATAQFSVVVQTDLKVSIRRGGTTGTVVATTASALSVNVFTYIEVKVLIDATVGTAEVRFNGASDVALTGLNTRGSTTTAWSVFWLGPTSGQGWGGSSVIEFDDVVLLDGSGSAPWNTLIGDCRVDVRNPTGAGATTGWTPSTGSNWQNVDDAAPDNDTTYNSTASVNAVDTFVVQDAPVAGAAIYGVQHCLSHKKSDAGTCSIAPVVRHSSTDYVGSDSNPSTDYTYGLHIAQVNPGTSAQWTESDFNAAEFGYKRTA